MFVFLPGLPLLTIVMIILILKSRRDMHALKHEKFYEMLLIAGAAATILCVIFGVLGYKYIDNYQSAISDCPTSYPYASAIIAVGIIGLISLTTASAQAFSSNQKRLGWFTIICAIDLLFVGVGAWFISVFCLTF